MDWEDLGKKIIELGAPLLGGTLGGPGGATLGAMVARAVGAEADVPKDIYEKIEANPDAAVKLRELELKHEETLQELALKRVQVEAERDLGAIREVNATMREEARSEHWPQYSWRPFNGFSFPLAVMCIYFVLPLLRVTVPQVPQWVWVGWLSILGVSAYHRGKEKRTKAGEQSPGLIAGAISAIRGGR
ncbi:MAG: hypothetical protein JRI39_00980 [Deltaproteobacteria bacterium]|nr:hypothetical protein [Deltaproteobacteria bacterium]